MASLSNLTNLPSSEGPTKGMSTLPLALTSLVGRDKDLAALATLLARPEVRLVTLIGPGGVGKTRLAVEAARGSAGRRVGGSAETDEGQDLDAVYFVGLAAVTAADGVMPAIGRTLGLREDQAEASNPVGRVVAALRGGRTLLVLDNLEQVVGAAPQLGTLLGSCPDLTLLVTSRVPLRIRGEREYAVEPLALPDSRREDGKTERREEKDVLPVLSADEVIKSPAVRLFVETAERVRPGFGLTAENAETVAEICRRLDGLPLAIELAAVRVKALSPAALLARLANRLNVLTSGPRDLPDRQQTLRDTIAWSYQLLTPEEQRLYRMLAVFSGGASLDAIEAVSGGENEKSLSPSPSLPLPPPIFDSVGVLIDHSLVRRLGEEDEPRLGMLETVREYGLEQLEAAGEAEAVRDRLAGWCLALAEAAERRVADPELPDWLLRLDAEGDNLRASFDWLIRQGDWARATRLAVALWRYWEVRGLLQEGRAALERALSGPGGVPDEVRGKALNNLGNVLLDLGDEAGAAARYDESLRLRRAIGDRAGEADTLNNSGLLAAAQGDLAAARARHEESLAIRREIGDRWGTALSISNLGDAATAAGEYDRAWDLQQEALAIRQGLGEPRAVGYTLNNLGEAAVGKRDLTTARGLFEAALETLRRVGDRTGVGLVLHNLGLAALAERAPDRAATTLAEAYRVRNELQEWAGAAETLAALAMASELRGEHERAVRMLAAATVIWPRKRFDPQVAELRAAMDRSAFEAAWSAGIVLSREAVGAEVGEVDGGDETRREDGRTGGREDGKTGRRVEKNDSRETVEALTPREREVLRLVSEGRTDREIGEELFVTTRTASTHVTNILGKLGLPSRTAAAAWAIRHGV